MKKFFLGLVCVVCFSGLVYSEEIIMNPNTQTEGINLNEADITPVKPANYKRVEDISEKVKYESGDYVKEIPVKGKRKFDLQLKRPNIFPSQILP